jgi:hypothetical protein
MTYLPAPVHVGQLCRYRVKRHRPELFGRRCCVRVVGKRMNQIAVEFEDGECHVTVRNCVEPVGDEYRDPAVQGNLF